MSKLLFANVIRLKNSKCFWGSLIFMLVMGVYIPFMKYTEMKETGYVQSIDDGFFNCSLFAAILLAVFCSMFIGTEYSDGTIRNKLIIGHKRTDIYFANLFTNMVVGLIMCVLYFAVYLCSGLPLLGFFESDIKVILLFAIIVIMLSFAFSAVFTMITMINSNKAIAVCICTLGVVFLIFVGAYIKSKLDEPETYSGYSFAVNGEVEWEDQIKNPNYIEGTEREIYQFLNDFLLGGQVIQCTSMEVKNPYRLPVYSAIIFLIMTSVGAVIFNIKDIK